MKKRIVSLLLTVSLLLAAFGAMAETSTLTQAGVDRSLYPWGEYLTETDIVSPAQGKEVYIKYTELFDEYTFATGNPEIGDMTYYFYDPIAHGADPEKEYPIAMWFHGGGNATQGKTAIMLCGAAAYASEAFQAELGGMYILFPMAKADKGWSEEWVPIHKALLDSLMAQHDIQGELIVAGQSMGGFMTNYWLAQHADITNIVMWINTRLPDAPTVQKYSDMGIMMLAENGIHDETIAFDTVYTGGPEAYADIENLHQTILEWIRNGDKSIMTINYTGKVDGEMAQHCSCLQFNRNLIFNDGTPDDPTLPNGITGWLNESLAKVRSK